jgi:ubiquinone/menaquinone biosynthesis C-methylase UbiE
MKNSPQTSGWQLESSAPDAYERYLVPALFGQWAEALVQQAQCGAGDRVLDAGCGTGIVARLAAGRVGPGGTVAGADVNPAMVAVARRVASRVRPAIRWDEADMCALPFADHTFNVTLCQFALMFVPDRVAALTELRRVTEPGGRVVLTVWRDLARNPGWSSFATALERHAGAAAANLMRTPFSLGDPDDLRGLFAQAGFEEVRLHADVKMTRFPSPAEMIRRQAASSPLAGPVGALNTTALRELEVDLAGLLRQDTDDGGVAFPSEAYIVIARR